MANNNPFNGMALEHAYQYADNKRNWGSGDDTQKSVSTLNNQIIRDYYGITEDVPLSEVEKYIAGLEEAQQRTATKKALLTNITNTETNPNVKNAADAIMNFSYDPSKDAAYQAYVDMYNRQGQSAAKQTLNNLNAATMGVTNSYSAAAAAQVQQAYAQKASEMIPTLAQQAYEKLMNNYSIARDMDDTEYNRALTGYQAMADDYTRGLTDEAQKLNNEAAKTEFKYLEQKLQQQVALGYITNEQAMATLRSALVQAEIDEKYGLASAAAAFSGGGSGGGSGGSSSEGFSTKNVDNFIKGFNATMATKDYYNSAGVDGDILTGSNGEYAWNSNIGGKGAWEQPLIEAIFSSPILTSDEQQFLINKLGLNKNRSYHIDENNPTEVEWDKTDGSQNYWIYTNPYERYYNPSYY